MNPYCVVVANGARARFFTLETAEFPGVESGPNLVEHDDIINPQQESLDRELWSDIKPGRTRAPNGGPTHGYDDHRSQHLDEFERRFARSIAQESAQLAQTHKAKHIVLVAQKRMLGFLRSTLRPLLKAGVRVNELAKDLSKLPPQELHEHLAREQLIPPRRHPTA